MTRAGIKKTGALVIGGAHGSLAVVRSLGRHGIPVCYVTDDHPIASYSRYTERSFIWAGPDDDGAIEVLTAVGDFETVKNALEAAGLKPEVAEVTMRAENTIDLAGEDAAKMQRLLDVLEDLDDVQDVYHNAAVSE